MHCNSCRDSINMVMGRSLVHIGTSSSSTSLVPQTIAYASFYYINYTLMVMAMKVEPQASLLHLSVIKLKCASRWFMVDNEMIFSRKEEQWNTQTIQLISWCTLHFLKESIMNVRPTCFVVRLGTTNKEVCRCQNKSRPMQYNTISIRNVCQPSENNVICKHLHLQEGICQSIQTRKSIRL